MGRQEALGGAATRVSIKNFSQDATELIRELEDFGWTFRRSNHGVVGRAPNDKTTTSISRNLRKSNHSYQKARADFRRWLRVAHPELVDAALAYVNDVDALADVATTDPVTAVILSKGAQARASRALRTSIADAAAHAAALSPELSDADPTTETESETMSTATAIRPATGQRPHVTATEPWRPKNMYRDAIPRATKQVWSDGTVNYRCNAPGCTFTSHNPRSVTQHYGANHTRNAVMHGAGPLSAEAVAELSELHDQLVAAEASTSSAAETIAELAEPIVEEPAEVTEAAEVAEVAAEAEATAEAEAEEPAAVATSEAADILGSVQRLVSAPLLAEIADLKAQIALLLDENAELALSCSKTQDALRQLQSDWDALRSLIGGH